MTKVIRKFSIPQKHLNTDLQIFVISLSVEIREGEKTRIQAYEGVVISQKNSGLSQTRGDGD